MVLETYFDWFGAKSVGAYLRASAKIRTMAYTHLWDTRNGRNTHFLLNNFVSTLSPGFDLDLTYSIEIYDMCGRRIIKSYSTIPAFAGKSVDVRKLLNGSHQDSFGMAIISILQDRGFRKLISFSNAYVIGSYFFAAWEDSSGHISCSHAIEGFKGFYYNVPRWMSRFNRVEKWTKDQTHKSNKAISTTGLEQLEIFLNNPSTHRRNTQIRISGAETTEYMIETKSRSTKLLTLKDPSLWAKSPHLQLEFYNLPTGNAKPYCFLKYTGNSESIGFHT